MAARSRMGCAGSGIPADRGKNADPLSPRWDVSIDMRTIFTVGMEAAVIEVHGRYECEGLDTDPSQASTVRPGHAIMKRRQTYQIYTNLGAPGTLQRFACYSRCLKPSGEYEHGRSYLSRYRTRRIVGNQPCGCHRKCDCPRVKDNPEP